VRACVCADGTRWLDLLEEEEADLARLHGASLMEPRATRGGAGRGGAPTDLDPARTQRYASLPATICTHHNTSNRPRGTSSSPARRVRLASPHTRSVTKSINQNWQQSQSENWRIPTAHTETVVVSASFLNAKPAVGGIGGVVPHRGDVRVVFTVASDASLPPWRTPSCASATTYDYGMTTNIFDDLSDNEEAQHRALWPAFLAARAGEGGRGRSRSSSARAS
jgi:hypothetical protein